MVSPSNPFTKRVKGKVAGRALGLEDDRAILQAFYDTVEMRIADGKPEFNVGPGLVGARIRTTVTHPKTGEDLIKKGRRVRPDHVDALRKAKVKWVAVQAADSEGAVTVADVVDGDTGEVLHESANPLTNEALAEKFSRTPITISRAGATAPT